MDNINSFLMVICNLNVENIYPKFLFFKTLLNLSFTIKVLMSFLMSLRQIHLIFFLFFFSRQIHGHWSGRRRGPRDGKGPTVHLHHQEQQIQGQEQDGGAVLSNIPGYVIHHQFIRLGRSGIHLSFFIQALIPRI